MSVDYLPNLVLITRIATKWLYQHGSAGLVLDDRRQHDLVKVRAMIPPVALGDVHDSFSRGLVAVIAPIDMKARRVKMHMGGAQVRTLGGSRRDETIECSHSTVIKGIQGTTESIIVRLLGGHPGRDELRGGPILEEPGDQVKCLIDKPQAIEHHRFDRKAEVIQDLAMVGRLLGQNHLL
jgi:hypothetical protein